MHANLSSFVAASRLKQTLFEPPTNVAFLFFYQCLRLLLSVAIGCFGAPTTSGGIAACPFKLEMDQVVLHVLDGNTARDMIFNPITGVWEGRCAGGNFCSLLNYCNLSKLYRPCQLAGVGGLGGMPGCKSCGLLNYCNLSKHSRAMSAGR